MKIHGAIVVITGGIGGIGFPTVQYLLKNEAKYVAIFDLPEPNEVSDSLQKLEEEFGSGRYGYYKCDVTNSEEFADLYEKVTAQYEYIDILINGAGIGSEKNIDLIIDINFKAVLKCTMIAINHMAKSKGGKGGVIIEVSSLLGLINDSLAPTYCATKHAVVSFVQSMKEHNKTLGVRIKCICPSYTETNMINPQRIRSGLFDFIDERAVENYLDAYIQKPDNVAAAIVDLIKAEDDTVVWVVQNDQPAFAVENLEDIKKLQSTFLEKRA